MNLPNKLTLLRALMVPVFVFFILFPTENVVFFRMCRVLYGFFGWVYCEEGTFGDEFRKVYGSARG